MSSDKNQDLEIAYNYEINQDDFLEQQIETPYLLNLLFRSFRNLQAMIQPQLQARGHFGIGIAETRILLALARQGMRISTLAEQTNTSRQFTSRVVHTLEQNGYVATTPDPSDGRATLITLGERGREYFYDIQDVKQNLDGVLADMIGKEQLSNMVATLQELIEKTTVQNQKEG